MVTASGSPSGTATTTMVTAMMKASRTASNHVPSTAEPDLTARKRMAMRATNVAPAAAMPT